MKMLLINIKAEMDSQFDAQVAVIIKISIPRSNHVSKSPGEAFALAVELSPTPLEPSLVVVDD